MRKTPEDVVNKILVLKALGFSSRKIAKLVLGSASKKSTVGDILSRVNKQPADEKHPNILLFDIETSFQMFGGFGRFNQNFSEMQVFENTKLLGACAKWLGSEDVIEVWPEYFKDWSSDSQQRTMLRKIWWLLDKADYVIAHNAPFDTKMINAFLVQNDIARPSPYRVIDTLRIAKSNFRFDSNRLDSLGKFLGVGRKMQHTGFDLWRGCVAGDTDSFKLMLDYCVQDVLLLEDIYMKLRHWDSNHPNLSIHYENKHRCGVCGSEALYETGKKTYTNASSYDLLACSNCGSWHRVRKSDKSETKTLVGVK